ncbi:MAG TPA: class I SAM-dependent methyltransferase [Candidatus Angelobacter sp.]|jgi:SAM-dependent methyltransferase
MKLFPHREFTYYFFGLRAGLANLRVNGLRLGLKKTAGKIMQPINSYTRFPEYYWFDRTIRSYLAKIPSWRRPAVLDVGSPKMFGLYLAAQNAVDLHLTDISELNVDEYQVMWRALQGRAKSNVTFSLEDARKLTFPSNSFDIVYSMSVLEHIDGERGDSVAIGEVLRVLKPGGLLILSVPFGREYVEQKRIGFSGAVRKTGDQQTYFFQRIYDQPMLQSRLVDHLANLQGIHMTTVQRIHSGFPRLFTSLGENVRGILGALNPFLSALANRSCSGIDSSFAMHYDDLHTAQDVYGDFIVAGVKS